MTQNLVLNAALSGGIAVTFGIIGVCFIRFWRRSRIKLFLLFAIAFFLLTAERMVLLLVDPNNEFAFYIYVIRLAAFLTIIIGIIGQNRRGPGS